MPVRVADRDAAFDHVGVDASGVALEFLSNLRKARRFGTDEAWDRVSELLDKQVEWRFAGGDTGAPWWNRLTGLEAVLNALRSPGSAWVLLHSETVNVFSDGEHVIVEQLVSVPENIGEGEWRKPVAHIFAVHEGMIDQIRTYQNDLQTNVHHN